VRFGTLSERLVLVREHAALDVNQASEGRFPADVSDSLEFLTEFRYRAARLPADGN
jgi:hypothetical protein